MVFKRGAFSMNTYSQIFGFDFDSIGKLAFKGKVKVSEFSSLVVKVSVVAGEIVATRNQSERRFGNHPYASELGSAKAAIGKRKGASLLVCDSRKPASPMALFEAAAQITTCLFRSQSRERLGNLLLSERSKVRRLRLRTVLAVPLLGDSTQRCREM